MDFAGGAFDAAAATVTTLHCCVGGVNPACLSLFRWRTSVSGGREREVPSTLEGAPLSFALGGDFLHRTLTVEKDPTLLTLSCGPLRLDLDHSGFTAEIVTKVLSKHATKPRSTGLR